MAEEFTHKNRLQEYAQRSAIGLPIYHTINEGYPHAPQFRSSVIVDGATFSSPCTFKNKKAAEQCVAKHAFEVICNNIKKQGIPLIHNDTTFCKSVLHEYAVKLNMKLPTYETCQEPGMIPVFVSSVLFDNKTFKGGIGRTKKEAEQIGARAVIEFILGNSDTRTLMTQIIKSKGRLYAALHKGNGSCLSEVRNAVTAGPNIPDCNVKGKKTLVTLSCETSHADAHLKAISSGPLINTAAAQSISPEVQGEHASKPTSNLIGTVDSLPTPVEALTASGSTSDVSRTNLGEPANTAAGEHASKLTSNLIGTVDSLPTPVEVLTASGSTSDVSNTLGEPYIVSTVQGKIEYPLAFSPREPANTAAAQSIPPGAEGENTGSGLITSGNSLPTPTEAVTPGGSTSGAARTDSGECHTVHLVQIKVEDPLGESGNPPSLSQDMVPVSSKKHRKKHKAKSQRKKARMDEQSPSEPPPPAQR